jgi:mannosyltransferase
VIVGALVIVALAAALRLEGLARDGLSFDETASREYAWWPLSHPRHWNNGMALYHSILHVWVRVAGDSEAALRVPSALFGIAGVTLLMLLVARIHGWKVALPAGLLMAVAWRHVFYSQEMRSYALFISLVVASTLLLVRFLERPGAGRLVAYGVALAALSYSHYQWVFVIVFHNLVVVFSRRRVGWGWAMLHGAIAIAYVPQILLGLVPHLHSSLSHMPRSPTGPEAIWAVQDFFALPPQRSFTEVGPLMPTLNIASLYGLPVVALAGLAVCGLPVLLRFLPWLRRVLPSLVGRTPLGGSGRPGPGWLPLVWFGAMFVLPFLIGQMGKPTFRSRYMAGVLPVYCWFIGLGITALPRVWLRVPGLVICVLLATPALTMMKQMSSREDWRGSAQEIARNERPGDEIVLCDGLVWRPFNYYYDGSLPQTRIGRDLKTDTAIRRALAWEDPPQRVWLVVSHDPDGAIIDHFERRSDYALVRDCSDTFMYVHVLLFERIEPGETLRH